MPSFAVSRSNDKPRRFREGKIRAGRISPFLCCEKHARSPRGSFRGISQGFSPGGIRNLPFRRGSESCRAGKVLSGRTAAPKRCSVIKGYPPVMPKIPLTDQEISEIVAYLETLR